MNDLKSVVQKIETLKRSKKYAEALKTARNAMTQFAGARPISIQLAQINEIYKQYQSAFNIYQTLNSAAKEQNKAVEFPVVMGLTRCLIKLENHKEAKKILENIASKLPKKNVEVLTGLATCARLRGEIQEAEKLILSALDIDKNNIDALFEAAQIYLLMDKASHSLNILEKNFNRSEPHGDSIDLWISTLTKLNRTRYAQDQLEILSKKFPTVIEFVYGFASMAQKAGEISLARPAYEKALKLSPKNFRILYDMGVLERIAGNLERSQQLISSALDQQPDNPAAIRTFGSDLKYEYGDVNYKRLNYVAAKFSEFKPIEQIHLHYAMAKAQEDVGEMDAAFRNYEIAGAKKRKLDPFKESESIKMNNIIPKVITPERLKLTNQTGNPSEIPVFVLGMPRSGTTLLEQVLSAHPKIFGAGELKILPGVLENIEVGQNRLRLGDREPVFPYEKNASWNDRGQAYVDRLIKLADNHNYQRIVDKMPGNYNFVGLISAILPNAKIIHSRRHPVETCLSIYRIHFAEGHQWSYNLKELGRYYKRYWNLMKHWREKFPGIMYEAIYEENVADVETSARKLIKFLDLKWDDNCLQFYNVDRPVKTASVTQVRKPIYKTSTNRWRKYEKYLGPLLEEIGDLVTEYENQIAHLIEK